MCRDERYRNKEEIIENGCDLTELITNLQKIAKIGVFGAERNKHIQKITYRRNLIF
jgi:uncharacterized protein (DUF4213/DUF364 family)